MTTNEQWQHMIEQYNRERQEQRRRRIIGAIAFIGALVVCAAAILWTAYK